MVVVVVAMVAEHGVGQPVANRVGLRQRLAEAQAENAVLRTENAGPRAEAASLREENTRLHHDNQQLHGRVEQLQTQVEQLQRQGKRQAAPFSRNKPKPDPKRPGRKPGAEYGTRARRPVPDRVNREVEVPLPDTCTHCGGEVELERVAHQYQEDLPEPRPTDITRFHVSIGRCGDCGRRVQPRHPEQTSDALGAAGVQLGPRVVAFAAWLSKSLGLSAAKVARVLAQFGLSVTPGGVTQAVARAARRAQPTYAALVKRVRDSPVVAPDETGWRVNGATAWLWAFVGAAVVVYRIATGEGARGYAQANAVLGPNYAGVLERDGWAPYRRFTHARHQSCLAHLLRRCHQMIDRATRGQARTPRAVARVLHQALEVRDRRDAGELSAEKVAEQATQLGAEVDKLVAGRTRYPPNRRLLKHLARERGALFTFLTTPGVQATNWRAEHAIRPAVVCRKSWGGNRTRAGADTWQVLASVLTTAAMQDRDPVAVLIPLLRAQDPVVADLSIPTQAARGP
jgi:transposase